MGIVSKNVGINNWNTLINLSDDLMYDSKSIIGNVIIYNNKRDLEYRINFLKSVDEIFIKGLIKLNYNPNYSLYDNSAIIYNISSLWEHNGQKFYASDFLPSLKRKGYLTDLDKNALKALYLDYKDRSDMNNRKVFENRNSRYAITLSEDTLINSNNNGVFELIKSLSIPKSKIIFRIQEKFLDNTRIRDVLHNFKLQGFALGVDNFTIDLLLRESEKYKDIEVFKLGNSLANVLLEKEFSKIVLKECIYMLVNTGKTVIVEGVKLKDIDFIISNISSISMKNILYSEKNKL
jgi:EAL domain-containing protein (putative c-di-GMP-specific phosphodiesterase class I)